MSLWPLEPHLPPEEHSAETMAAADLSGGNTCSTQVAAYATPLSIAFAFVATHNHFVLDRGGKVFKRTAPVIKLPEGRRRTTTWRCLGC